MKKLILVFFALVASSVSSQAQVCAGLVGMQAQLCPLHGQIHAAFPPGGAVTLATLQTQLSAVVNTANSNGIISNPNAATLNAQIGSGGTAGSVLGVPPTAAQLRTVLLNINTDGTPADYQPSMVSLINGSFPSGNTIGISAEDTREVLKDLTLTMFRTRIGTNLQWPYYFNNNHTFTDVALTFNGNFGTWDNGNVAATQDSTGAPTTCATTCQAAFSQTYPSGPGNVYTLSWIGSGNVNCTSQCTRGTPTTIGGRQVATLTITPPPLWVPATGTIAVGLNATLPVTDIHLIAPVSQQYQSSPSQPCTTAITTPCTFLNSFISLIRPFTSYRLMDALRILPDASSTSISQTMQNWVQRTWPSSAIAASCTTGPCVAGGAGANPPNNGGWSNYEVWINLANILQKDLYINMYMYGSDNYTCRLARLIIMGESGATDNGSNCNTNAASCAGNGALGCDEPQSVLNPNSHIYLEWCNEQWNSGNGCWNTEYCIANGGPQGSHTCTLGTTVPSGMTTLAAEVASANWANLSNFPNAGVFGRQCTVSFIQAMSYGKIFQAVYAAAGKSSAPVRPVQNSQTVGICGDGPLYMNMFHNPMSSYMFGVAQAPYFALANSANNTSVSAIFTDLNANVFSTTYSCGTYQLILNMKNQASPYSLNVMSYEGAQGIGLGDNCCCSNISQSEHDAQIDPQMYAAYITYFGRWVSVLGRGSQFHNFTLTGQYNSGGSDWGALYSNQYSGSQKYDAMLNLLLKPGDVNGDGVVDINDCLIIQQNFNVTPPTQGFWWRDGDLNHDGLVNQADKNILNSVIRGPQCL